MSRPAISYPMPSNNGGHDAFDEMPSRRSHSQAGFYEPISAGGNTLPTRSSSSQSRGPTSTLDSFITRLLVVTKQLLQGLDQWSQGVLSEEDVSDIYVRLGNGFELCVAAFRRVGIPTTDLDSVPRDLREILERALAEEPSQDTLNIYLPDIRAIIFNLLSGLKAKQTAYKRLQADRQQQQPEVFTTAGASGGAGAGAPGRPPRLSGTATPEGPGSPGSISSVIGATARSQQPSSAALAERNSQQARDRRAAPPDAFRPARSRPSGDSFSKITQDHLPTHSPPPSSVQTIQTTPPPVPSPPNYPTGAGTSRPPSRPSRASRESLGHSGNLSHFSVDSEVSSETTKRPSSGETVSPSLAESKPSPAASVPAVLPTINLPNDALFPEPHPHPPPAPAPPAPPSPVAPRSPAATTLTDLGDVPQPRIITDDVPQPFARLQRTEALERRASKRFSSYTFNKMLPGSPTTKKAPNASPQRPNRRANDRLPPMPALHEDGRPLSQVGSVHGITSISSAGSSPIIEHTSDGRPVSMMGGLGIVVDGPDGTAAQLERHRSAETAPSPTPTIPKPMTVFLQLGRQVKKTSVELPLTQSALRLLFMERFEYDPGMEDFPDVYIRDNRTGVQYELEDMDDLQEGCVLTLDVEPLDQVKLHFDLGFAQLSQEFKELKSTMNVSRRMSMQVPSLLGVTASPTPVALSPTNHLPPSLPLPSRPLDRTPEQPMARPLPASQQRSVSAGSIPANNVDLQRHHKEVQDLRTDLAVLRQIHLDFLSGVKEQFTALRAENTAMREVVKSKMGGNRAILDNSKAKLDAQCQDTIQVVEEVSDIIDGAREDALRRGITPSRVKMDKIQADLAKATSLVEVFSTDVTLAEPTWRATWLTELQRVTEEQRLLAYQNKLAADLKNDIKDAAEMLGNVNAYVGQRAGAPGKKFRPPSPEQGAGGISTLLLEIRTKESDPNQRLRAIEEQRRARERELASQTDEFTDELAGFVQGKRLRKTGGTEEAERVRQRRHDQTVKRMLSGDVPPGESPRMISPQATGTGNP